MNMQGGLLLEQQGAACVMERREVAFISPLRWAVCWDEGASEVAALAGRGRQLARAEQGEHARWIAARRKGFVR